MKIVLFALFMVTFGPFTVLANNLTCYKCHARNSDYCKGEDHQCPTRGGCMTVFEKAECFGSFHSLKRRCGSDLPCNITMYAYVNETVFFSLGFKCCHHDHCNNGSFEVPKIGNETDGPQCPACLSVNTTKLCKPERKTICIGEDDKCVKFIGGVRTPGGLRAPFTGQGCMSKNACEYDFTNLIGMQTYNITTLQCYDPVSPDSTK